MARQLARHFTQQGAQPSVKHQNFIYDAPGPPSLIGSKTNLHSMPPAVKAHFAKLLLDWAQSALVKGRIAAAPQASPQEYLQKLSSTWQLLCAMLLSGNTAHVVPNVSLIAAAAAFCKACTAEQAQTQEGQKLAAALQQTLLVLNTRFKHTFRPSLEHRSVFSPVVCQIVHCPEHMLCCSSTLKLSFPSHNWSWQGSVYELSMYMSAF